MKDDQFLAGYKSLNKDQKLAVDTIEGPVMVVAGPGTGKTQILTLRIANILKKTDTPADGILCLTFTNSGVRAMRERLLRIVGGEASRVKISTFHSFASSVLEEFYETIGLNEPPKLIDDKDSVILCDELLENGEWKYLRTRSGGAHNFRDLKSLISLVKRERITLEDFRNDIQSEIKILKKDPGNISSRGPNKGEIKKDVQEKIGRFDRTLEAVDFLELYEMTKEERGLADYDDIIAYLVRVVEESKDARDSIREKYLYILVDEHQDSSKIQNEFLERVWGSVEKPNLFVVGDDRQLIYAFGGASLEHFENFKNVFTDAKIIPLIENYRSTQNILDTADKILESSIVKNKLKSNRKENHSIRLVEANYPRDEILSAGLAIKQKIKEGVVPEECAIIVPKNAQVRSAIPVLLDLGLPVAEGVNTSFFSTNESHFLINVLSVISNPYDNVTLGNLLLDQNSGIETIEAHKFLRDSAHKLSIESLKKGDEKIKNLGVKLNSLIKENKDIYALIQRIGEEFFFQDESDYQSFLRRVEVIRTMLHLALSRLERDPKLTLSKFLEFITRLISYGEDLPLAVFGRDEGVKVMTMHSSKGLEFDFVWLAHIDESSIMKGKRMGFVLPESLAEKVAKKDEFTARRELYVALTRAKRFATLSYAKENYTGGDLQLSSIITGLPEDTFEKINASVTEKEILKHDPKAYVASEPSEIRKVGTEEIKKYVSKEYANKKLSVTHLNNFFSCPWKWYFRNFLMLPEKESESLQFGNIIHYSLNRIFKDGSLMKNIPSLVDEEIEKMKIYKPEVAKRFKKESVNVLKHYVDKEIKNIAELLKTEQSLFYRNPEFPHLEVTGKIDLIEMLDDDTLRVTDFKTGKAYGKRDIEKRDEDGRLSDKLRQLAMYSYLIKNQKEEKVVSSSRLLFLESEGDKDRVYETEITPEIISLLHADLKDFDEALLSGNWTERECRNNSFGKECEYCKMADLIK